MTRSVATSVENNFTGGYITEASTLNFPERACTDMENCVLDLTGTIERRDGFDFEFGHSSKQIATAGQAIVGYLWNNVAGDGTVYLYVLQVGSTLYFYNATTSATAISGGALSTTIDLTAFSPSGAPSPALNECQFSAGDGYLFVTHSNLEPFAVAFTAPSTFTTTQINIKIRDFDGIVEAGVVTPTRSASLTTSHNYNLLNQGWTDGSHGDVTSTNLISTWHTAESNYPSNADVWWQFKDATDVFNPTTMAASVNLGNTPAANGHFILNAFNQDRSTASGIAGFTAFTSGGIRPSSVAFYSGRVFFAGVNTTGFNNSIYFSQIIDISANPTAQFGLCYQNDDPTSQDSFDLLPSDGGVIKIADCGTIYKLFPIQGALLVFASNGIWTITGSQGLGFKADDYSVNKLSSIKCISGTSFVDVLGFPMWWSSEGIYSIRVDTGAGGLRIDSLTDTTVRTFFETITLSSKQFARGFYNPIEFTVQWLYRSTPAVSVDDAYTFDSILTFNTLLGAFSPWKVNTTNVKIHGITVINASGGSVSLANVVNDLSTNNPVFDNLSLLDPIVTFSVATVTTFGATFKYLCSYTQSNNTVFSFGETRDELTYVDWKSFDNVGQAYESNFTTGFKVHGQGQRKFQFNYLYVFLDNTVPSQVYVQGLWNTALGMTSTLGTTSGKLTSRQLISVPGTNFSAQYKRLKIRGEGLILQLKFSSVAGQPYRIYGWSTFETGNSSP